MTTVDLRTHRSLLTGWIACVLLVSSPGAAAGAAPTRDRLTPMVRAVDESDPSLVAAAETVRTRGDAPLPDPARLFAEAAEAAGELATAQRLSDAAESWTGAMMRDGGWWFVMVGSASNPVRQSVRASARAVVALSAGATAVTDRAVDAADRASAEGRPIAEDDALILAIHTRQIVLPLRAARATIAVAASESSEDRRKRLSAMSLEAALRVEPVSAWSEVERFLVSGWGLLLLDRHDESFAAFEKARTAALAKDAPPGVRDAAMIESALGSTLVLLRSRGPVTAREALTPRFREPAFMTGRSGMIASLAAIDVMLQISAVEAATLKDGTARLSALAWPWRQAQDLANRSEDPERAAIYAHLSRAVGEAGVAEQMPPIAHVTHGWSLLKTEPPRLSAAGSALEALARPASPPTDAVGRDAWIFYTIAGEASDDPSVLRRTAEIGTAYASCCADDPRAFLALGSAARASERLLRIAADSGTAEWAETQLISSLLLLDLADLRVEDGDRDPWRLVLGRVLLRIIGRSSLSGAMTRAKGATETLRRVSGEAASLEAEALIAQVWSALLRQAEQESDEEAPVERLASTLADLTDPKRSRAASSASPRSDLQAIMTACRAQALMARRRAADALSELERLISDDAAASAPPLALEVAVEAFASLENESEARRLVQRMASAPAVLARLSRLAWRGVLPATEGFIAGGTRGGTPPITVFRLAAETARETDQIIVQRTRLAWALLLAGRAEESVVEFSAVEALDPRNASVLRGLGESLLESGDEAGAFARFSTMAQALEAQQEFSRDYWHAWTRMLEILSRRPRTPDSDATIRREIARLRGMPSALEHPACLSRLRDVEERLAGP